MKIYVDDLVTFSKTGFEEFSPDIFESDEDSIIESIETEHIAGKGFKYVPRSVKLIHNVVSEVIKRNNLSEKRTSIGLFNSNDITSLDGNVEFDLEVEKYGVNMASPMKVPFTLGGSALGFTAIKNKLNNTNLTINLGRTGVVSTLSEVYLEFLDKKIECGILVDAHFMDFPYVSYSQSDILRKEFVIACLISKRKTNKSFIEITESRTLNLQIDSFKDKIFDKNRNIVIDCSPDQISISEIRKQDIIYLTKYSDQMSLLFPFLVRLKNDSFLSDALITYIILDKNDRMGLVKLKKIKYNAL
jgi:hypothetical protein